jgi:bifunctional non-homologous end joining protein LigD
VKAPRAKPPAGRAEVTASAGAADPLAAYHAKRDFSATAEPPGAAGRSGPRLGYLIQKHDATRLHYDFRLELDGVLKSWAVTRGPSLDPRDKRLAVRVEDHPLDYGSFEGTIPKGEYGGGTVMLWDRGSWAPIGDPHAGLAAGELKFELSGERLKGRWVLVRMRGKPRETRENWLLIKEHDEHESGEAAPLDADTSIATGRSMEDIAEGVKPAEPAKPKRRVGRLPEFVEPALATLVDAVPAEPGWIFEIKYDGYRAVIAASGADVRIHTRTGLDWTGKFPEISAAIASLGLDRALIDSEIVALDDAGRSSFSLLQQRLQAGRGGLSCFAFDLLALKGKTLRQQSLTQRKKSLQALLASSSGGPVFCSESFDPKEPEVLLEECCKRGLEGLIAKRADAPYYSGRHPSWLKIKCRHQQELIIIGWSKSRNNRAFSSLLLGVREAGGLRYAGRVGTGFDAATLASLSARLAELRVDAPAAKIPREFARDAGFAAPVLVAEIALAGWTHDGMVRQARFLGLREDKPAQDVVQEQPAPAETVKAETAKSRPGSGTVAGIAISHPDKILYDDAGITKRDLAAYLDQAGPALARFAANRFVSLVRCPRGQGRASFFQRHVQPGLERYWLTRDVLHKQGHPETYMYFRDRAALIEAAQMDVLEFHIWGSTLDRLEQPDRIVFDLDPAPELSFAALRDAALHMRDILLALKLESLPLLTGGKGIHVVVPVTPTQDFATVKQFSGRLAERVAEAEPDRFVATMSKAKREGRIFIDYFRNDWSASAVAPFSPRNRPGAPVAWPVQWDDLRRIESANAVSITEARARLETGETPWKTYDDIRQSLGDAQIRSVTGD